MSRARDWIRQQLDAERGRWVLWLPVALGFGIAIYFELPSEPTLWLGPLLAAGGLVLAFFAPAGSLGRALAIAGVTAALGFGLIAWRTVSLAAPTLGRPLFSINVEGRIADIQRLPDSVRVVLESVRLRGNNVPPLELTPVRLRVSLNKGAPEKILTFCNLDQDVKKNIKGSYEVWTHNGSINTGRSPRDFIISLKNYPCGEIVLNSIDHDGMMKGYDLALIEEIFDIVTVPLTILGGAGSNKDIEALITRFGLIGAAAGSLFVFKGPYRAVLINYPSIIERDELMFDYLKRLELAS